MCGRVAFIKLCVLVAGSECLDSDRQGNEALGGCWDGTRDASDVCQTAAARREGLSVEHNINYKTNIFVMNAAALSRGCAKQKQQISDLLRLKHIQWTGFVLCCCDPCRGQGCHKLILDVHPLKCGMIMGQNYYKGRVKQQLNYGNEHQQIL